MFRPPLDLTPLEGRLAPSGVCPPEDPMDNPPPALPGGGTGGGGDTKLDDKPGKGGPGFTVTPPVTTAAAVAPAPLPVTAALLGRGI